MNELTVGPLDHLQLGAGKTRVALEGDRERCTGQVVETVPRPSDGDAVEQLRSDVARLGRVLDGHELRLAAVEARPLTVTEYAAAIRCSERRVRGMIARGEVAVRQPGRNGRWLVTSPPVG